MFIVFFLFWVILNGRLTVEIALFGAAISAVMYFFVCRFMDWSFRKDLRLAGKLGTVFRLLGTLAVEIVKANLQVVRWVYAKKKPNPCIVRFEADLKTEAARVMLADCITLTPGTITGREEGNRYVVHCLDESMSEGLDTSDFVEILKKLEED